jgi:hypothetical protein
MSSNNNSSTIKNSNEVSQKYKIIGFEKDTIKGNKYVTDKNTGKILFDNNNVAKYEDIPITYTFIYLFDEDINVYFQVVLGEMYKACNKNTQGKIGTMSYGTIDESIIKRNLENENIYMNIDLYNYSEEVSSSYYHIDNPEKLIPLFEYSYDGGDELYSNGYVKLYSFLEEK